MMVISWVRGSRFLRALVLTTGVFSLLLWLYIVLRVVFNSANRFAPFIYSISWIRIWVLGAILFDLCFPCTFVYVWLWGRFDRLPVLLSGYQGRAP